MSAWDPWWVHGDYAETYHGTADEEEDELAALEAQLEHKCELIEDDDLWV